MSKPLVIFFILSTVPTAEEMKAKESLENNKRHVVFRNGSNVGEGESLERAEAYAGAIPDAYRKRFAGISEFLEAGEEPKSNVESKPAGNSGGSQSDEAKAKRQAEDDGAKAATAGQLKDALDQLGIKYPDKAKKADLLAAYLARP